MYKRYRVKRNEQGYTLLEALFQLVVFMLFTQFVLIIFASTAELVSTENARKQLDFELFVSELNTYLTRSTKFMLVDDTFRLDNINREDKNISYIFDSSPNNVRLTTPHGGNIIMLPEARSTPIKRLPNNQIQIMIKFKDQISKERTFIVPNKY